MGREGQWSSEEKEIVDRISNKERPLNAYLTIYVVDGVGFWM